MKGPPTERLPNEADKGSAIPKSPDEVTLDRTRQRPLQFHGTKIGFGTTKLHDSLVWDEVTIYKTVGGGYVADVVHSTQSQSEPDVSEALTRASAQELIAALTGEDGKLDRASFAACEEAVQSDAGLRVYPAKACSQ